MLKEHNIETAGLAVGCYGTPVFSEKKESRDSQ